MNTIARKLAALTLATFFAAAPLVTHAERVAKDVADYTVFLDEPTGFVFVKLPAGWKFAGKVAPADAARLPANVVTSLLTGDDEAGATRLAAAQPQR